MYEKHFRLYDALLAVATGAAVCLWLEKFDGLAAVEVVLYGNRAAVYGTLASILGALLGFAVTAVSIVFALWTSPALALVRRSPYAEEVGAICKGAIRSLAVATAVALALLVFDRDGAQKPYLLLTSALVLPYTTARVSRCLWLLEKMLSLATKKGPRVAQVAQSRAQPDNPAPGVRT